MNATNATKRSWFLFSAADAAAVTRRMNRWAQAGWELSDVSDGHRFFVTLTRTKRRELVYDAVPAMPGRTEETLRKTVQERESMGWEPMATVNGMDLYRSMPCCTPQPMPQTEGKRCIFAQEGPKLLFALLLTAIVLYLRTVQNAWYLSHLGIFWQFAALPMAVTTALFAIWFGVKCAVPSASSDALLWLRSVLSVLARVGLWLFLLLLALEWMPLGYAAALMLLGTGLMVFFQGRDNTVLSVPVMQSLVIGVGLILGAALSVVLPGASLSVDAPLSASDLQLSSGQREYEETSRQGTFLVTALDYGESWSDDVYFSGTTYRCCTEGMARQVMEDLLPDSGQTEGDDVWYSDDGSHLLVREGRYMVKLWVSDTDLRDEDTLQVLRDYCAKLAA